MQRKTKIILIAGITRVIVILLQFIANAFIPDHEADAFRYPRQNLPETVFDKVLNHFLGGFVRWDAQYFMHIASYGYTYENTLAFFPFYPGLINIICFGLSYCVLVLNRESLLLLIFIAFNCSVFIFSALALYDLTVLVLQSKHLAFKSAVLFCINPATVFFVAPYSECLFSYFTFKGMISCVKMHNSSSGITFKHLIFVSLSTCVRSNGILNIGFLAYFYFKTCLRRRRFLCIDFLMIAICAVPFLCVQSFSHGQFCTNHEHSLEKFLVDFAEVNNYVLPGSFWQHQQQWCFDNIPLAYSYVQDHYWNVGLLRYFELKQIPNFILAVPVIALVGVSTFKFVKEHPAYCLTLGLYERETNYHFKKEMFVFVVHAAFLTVFCTLCIHVQVTTRMICSASPVVYWFCAYYFKNVREDYDSLETVFLFSKNLNNVQRCIRFYFISYCIIGTTLFVNFFPWT